MPSRRLVSRLAAWAAAIAAVFVAGAVAGGAPAAAKPKPVVVHVTAKDFSFTLSRRSVPAGTTVRFVVRNMGGVVHDFAISGKRTKLLKHGQTAVARRPVREEGLVPYLCTVAGHARLGMKGVFAVGKKPAASQPPPTPPTVPVADTVQLTKIGGGFGRPVLVTAPPGDPRLFVVDQTGIIRVVDADGNLLPEPFLDIRDRVHFSSEPGLLGMAFAPDYATSGLVYVFYNSRSGNGDLVLAEYHVSATNPNLLDPYTWRTVLTIVKPWENHNGGMLQFGPDGDLYISVGDGDSGVLDPPGALRPDAQRPPRRHPPHRPARRGSVRGAEGQPVRRCRRRATPRSGPTACGTRGASGSTRLPGTCTSATRERARRRRST